MREMKEDSGFPPGWDEARVRRLLEHYESQTEEQAVAEDEESLADKTQTVMEILNELVPAVRDLLSRSLSDSCIRAGGEVAGDDPAALWFCDQ